MSVSPSMLMFAGNISLFGAFNNWMADVAVTATKTEMSRTFLAPLAFSIHIRESREKFIHIANSRIQLKDLLRRDYITIYYKKPQHF